MSKKIKKNKLRRLVSTLLAVTVIASGVVLAVVFSHSNQDIRSHASENIMGQMFISSAELISKPTSGTGWDYLKSRADVVWPAPNLSDQYSTTQTDVLAAALIYARDSVTYSSYKDKVIAELKQVCGTEINGTSSDQLLNLARTLYGYVVSADMVQMPYSTACNNGQTWQVFLEGIRTKVIPGNGRWSTLEITSADTSSNWGAYSLSSHLAVSYALNDTAAIQRDTDIFKRYLGDSASPALAFKPSASYAYNNNGVGWDMTPTLQRGINPVDPNSPGRSGAIIEDSLRVASSVTQSSPCCTTNDTAQGYQEEAMDGMLSTAQLLRAHVIDLTDFQDKAMLRAFIHWKQSAPSHYGDLYWKYLPYAINYLYGTAYPVSGDSVDPYRHMGYGSWLFTGTIPTTPTIIPTAAPTSTPTSTPFPPTPTPISVDTTSPSVTIVSPNNEATIARGKTLTITVNASDNVAVTKVQFYVNGSLKCTDTTAFYSCNWSVPSKPNATYTLKAIAYDGANNSSSNTVTVTAR